jgi:hypothetical protein
MPLDFLGDKAGTCYLECTKCGNPCDAKELKQEDFFSKKVIRKKQ